MGGHGEYRRKVAKVKNKLTKRHRHHLRVQIEKMKRACLTHHQLFLHFLVFTICDILSGLRAAGVKIDVCLLLLLHKF